MTIDDWPKLCKEVREWALYNFPGYTIDYVLLGIMEEKGELAQAMLKQKQGIKGTADDHDAAIRDAIGDLAIFLANFCAVKEIEDLHCGVGIHNPENESDVLSGLDLCCGSLWGHSQVLMSYCRVSHAMLYLDAFCEMKGWNLWEIVESVWSEVKQRDWQKYPLTGKPEPFKSQSYIPSIELQLRLDYGEGW